MYHNNSPIFNFLETSILFSTVATPIFIPYQQCIKLPLSPHPPEHLLSFGFFLNNSRPNCVRLYLSVLLICISLKISDVEHLFKFLLAAIVTSATIDWFCWVLCFI